MTWSHWTTIGLLVLCAGLLWKVSALKVDLQEVYTDLAITRSNLELTQQELAAREQAAKIRQQAQEEAADVCQRRLELLRESPDEWSDTLLPGSVLRVFKISPQDTVGPDRAATGADGADTGTGMDSAD